MAQGEHQNAIIKAAREEKGLSQAALGKSLGRLAVSGVAIRNYETGRSLPDFDRAKKLAAALGLDIEEIAYSDRQPRARQARGATEAERPKARRAKTRRTTARRSSVRAPARITRRTKSRRASTRIEAVVLTNPEEIAVIDVIRELPAAARRTVVGMLLGAGGR